MPNNKTVLLAGLVGVSIMLTIFYLTFKSSEPTTSALVNPSLTAHIAPIEAEQHHIIKGTDEPIVEMKKVVNENMADSFSIVASAYAEQIKLPPYSLPLTENDTQLLKPNSFFAQVVPLINGGSASIQLDGYRFIYPEKVTVKFILKKIQAYDVKLRLYQESTNSLLLQSNMLADEQGYRDELNAEENWEGPLRIEIEFKSGSQAQIIQTGFEYNQPIAKITGLGNSYIEKSNLIIPVKLTTVSTGYYRLRANLFDAQHRPLAALSESIQLPKGEAEIKLRAYKSLIEKVPTPLWLSTFQLENRSATPGQPTRFGHSNQPEFAIDYTGEGKFSAENYEPSEEEKQRLEFLQQMAKQK
jgi:hypothetical protein